ncbi:hypothetical protein ACFQY5_23155 [Paeniroseomonas aquatica]|uniref:hypothetical protein n=1 Tax=Paeniroseomonas aquatica TaxID=373043 RepID=UPI00361A168B
MAQRRLGRMRWKYSPMRGMPASRVAGRTSLTQAESSRQAARIARPASVAWRFWRRAVW